MSQLTGEYVCYNNIVHAKNFVYDFIYQFTVNLFLASRAQIFITIWQYYIQPLLCQRLSFPLYIYEKLNINIMCYLYKKKFIAFSIIHS